MPEKVMAPHSSTLAWKIPWTEEPGRLQSMGLRRVGHDWRDFSSSSRGESSILQIIAHRVPQPLRTSRCVPSSWGGQMPSWSLVLCQELASRSPWELRPTHEVHSRSPFFVCVHFSETLKTRHSMAGQGGASTPVILALPFSSCGLWANGLSSLRSFPKMRTPAATTS